MKGLMGTIAVRLHAGRAWNGSGLCLGGGKYNRDSAGSSLVPCGQLISGYHSGRAHAIRVSAACTTVKIWDTSEA